MELADIPVLETGASACGFDSHLRYCKSNPSCPSPTGRGVTLKPSSVSVRIRGAAHDPLWCNWQHTGLLIRLVRVRSPPASLRRGPKRIPHGVASEWDLNLVVAQMPSGRAVRFRTAPLMKRRTQRAYDVTAACRLAKSEVWVQVPLSALKQKNDVVGPVLVRGGDC